MVAKRASLGLNASQRALVTSPDARKLVVYVVRFFRRTHPHIGSAEIEALAGEALVLAARCYAPREATFATYARKRVVGHVIRAIRAEATADMSSLAALMEHVETTAPLRPEAGVSAEDTPEAARARLLDRKRRLAAEYALVLLTAPRDPEALLASAEERRKAVAALEQARARLAADEAHLIRRRYLEHATLKDVARELACSTRSAERLHDRALTSLRHALHASGVAAFPHETFS